MSRFLRRVAFGAALGAGAVLGLGAPASAAVPASPVAGGHGLGAQRTALRIAPERAGGVGALGVLPARVDLRAWAVTPGDQGAVSSCVTWAIDYGMLGWYARHSGRDGQPFAPMYTYAQINGGEDAGSLPSAALEIARTQGTDTRAHYSHDDYDWRDKPNAAERSNAARYRIAGWSSLFVGSGQVGSADAIKQALAADQPVAIELAVRRGFDELGSRPSAVDDDVTSAIRGYHEVLALGYDASGLVVENSWGTSWAAGGFGRISWRVVARDVWEADTISGFVALTPPTVTTPSVALAPAAKAKTAPAAAAYEVSWKGSAGTSGAITQYDAWYAVDGGPLVRVRLSSAKATSLTLSAPAGHTYRIAVRARAGATVGGLRFSAPVTPTPPAPPAP